MSTLKRVCMYIFFHVDKLCKCPFIFNRLSAVGSRGQQFQQGTVLLLMDRSLLPQGRGSKRLCPGWEGSTTIVESGTCNWESLSCSRNEMIVLNAELKSTNRILQMLEGEVKGHVDCVVYRPVGSVGQLQESRRGSWGFWGGTRQGAQKKFITQRPRRRACSEVLWCLFFGGRGWGWRPWWRLVRGRLDSLSAQCIRREGETESGPAASVVGRTSSRGNQTEQPSEQQTEQKTK